LSKLTASSLQEKPKNMKTSVNAPSPDRDFTPAEIVRIHEANCQIGFASAEEQNFRLAMMKFIGRRLGLAELRGVSLAGPGVAVPRPRPVGAA
jgi:hypothetical protein